PQYTRPADFRGWEVPEVLRSGDHARIESWRHLQALWRTVQQRPDLIEARGGLSDKEKSLLEGADPVSYPSLFADEGR
ncbi:MAG: tRNA ((37)-N1)-methyltransferase TrmD, partial [Actinomycetota bacterium]